MDQLVTRTRNVQKMRDQLKINLFPSARKKTLTKENLKIQEVCSTPRVQKSSEEAKHPQPTALEPIPKQRQTKKPHLLKYFEQLYETDNEQLGQGAHAIVKKYWKKKNKAQKYAVKIFRTGDPEIINTIIQTFNNNRLLNAGKGVIKAYDLFIDERREINHLVMEYCDYPSLENRNLDRKHIPSIMFQIAECMRFMHQRGVCHRDLKPDNILVKVHNNKNVDIKIIDFGVSKKFLFKCKEDYEYKLRDMWTRTGTILYSAPEIFEGGGYNEKVDMWSIGVVLYQLLTHKLPYQDETILETIESICNEDNTLESKPEFQSLDYLAKDLLRRLLKRNPEKRICCQG